MQCGTTLDATSTTTNGGRPQATYTSQCGVLQDAGVSRDAHAQAIKKTIQHFKVTTHLYVRKMVKRTTAMQWTHATQYWRKTNGSSTRTLKRPNTTCHGNDQIYTALRKVKDEGPIGEQ